MSSIIKHPKDFYAGLMYAAVGGVAALIATRYNFGSNVRMGPGYFPMVLSLLLVAAGVASMARSFLRKGESEKIAPFAWREIALVLGSVVLFGVIVRGAGLAPSLILLLLISAYASRRFSFKASVVLALASTVLSVLVFVKGLGLPLAAFGSWFGR